MMTPKVVSRSDASDFSSAFHEACIRPASSSSPTMRGSTTIWAAGCNFYVFVVQRKRNLLEPAPAPAQVHGRPVHQHEADDDHDGGGDAHGAEPLVQHHGADDRPDQ